MFVIFFYNVKNNKIVTVVNIIIIKLNIINLYNF